MHRLPFLTVGHPCFWFLSFPAVGYILFFLLIHTAVEHAVLFLLLVLAVGCALLFLLFFHSSEGSRRGQSQLPTGVLLEPDAFLRFIYLALCPLLILVDE